MIKIIVNSGKGGVGKTTISAVLAKKLAEIAGVRVGLLDADIDCPNVPEIMGITERNVKLSDKGIIPVDINGVEVMSVGLIADVDIAVMWSGERRTMAIEQFFNHVDWTCDVLIIDSPPGTSDEIISLIKSFNPDGILLVTTNHKASISDVKRTMSMINVLEAQKKLIGIVNNMSYIICDCGLRTDLFPGNGEEDEKIKDMTIAEIPYTTDEDLIGDSLIPVVDKICELI